MLHGNPTRDVLGGINIAASGELGVGVGEEDRGSGEREVLEGLVGRIEGLVDVVVSKFGDFDPDAPSDVDETGASRSWLGTGREPGAEDGAIFLGTGSLSRKSLRDVTHWMEDLYTWGDHAYGVIESPTSVRRGKIRKSTKTLDEDECEQKPHPGETNASADQASGATAEVQKQSEDVQKHTENPQPGEGDEGRLDKMVSYLKLGYGTYWSLPGGSSGGSSQGTPASVTPQPENKSNGDRPTKPRPNLRKRTSSSDAAGHYLIGLKGDIDDGNSDGDSSAASEGPRLEHNSRTVLRTINVELESEAQDRPEATIVRDFEHPASILTQSQVVGNMLPGYDSHDLNKAKKLRVVVYVNRPFIFAFLFQLRTDSLAWDTLYRSLHHQLSPLKKPLLLSTHYRPERPTSRGASSIYDLVWDPKGLTVHSTIPNIPENYVSPEPWSRPDAINTHLHLLNVHSTTRSRVTDLERTQKTNRGWWLVWTRLLERQSDNNSNEEDLATIHEDGTDPGTEAGTENKDDEAENPIVAKEIFLIRRASDHAGRRGSYEEGGGEGAGRLAQGIGVDTRRYVEELLNLL